MKLVKYLAKVTLFPVCFVCWFVCSFKYFLLSTEAVWNNFSVRKHVKTVSHLGYITPWLIHSWLYWPVPCFCCIPSFPPRDYPNCFLCPDVSSLPLWQHTLSTAVMAAGTKMLDIQSKSFIHLSLVWARHYTSYRNSALHDKVTFCRAYILYTNKITQIIL